MFKIRAAKDYQLAHLGAIIQEKENQKFRAATCSKI